MIVQLNNRGCLYLQQEQQHYDHAIDIFSNCLTLVKQSMAETKMNNKNKKQQQQQRDQQEHQQELQQLLSSLSQSSRQGVQEEDFGGIEDDFDDFSIDMMDSEDDGEDDDEEWSFYDDEEQRYVNFCRRVTVRTGPQPLQQQQQQHPNHPSSHNHLKKCSCCSLSSSSASSSSSTSSSCCCSSYSLQLTPVEEQYGYIYKHPMELKNYDDMNMTTTITNDDVDSECNTTMTESYDSLVVMFNLALSYQLKAAAGLGSVATSASAAAGTTTTASYHDLFEEIQWNITQSLSLYELCNAVLECENINAGPFFIMALTNNVGQCHSMTTSTSSSTSSSTPSSMMVMTTPMTAPTSSSITTTEMKAKRCFQHLLSIQMYLIDNNGGNSSDHGDDDAPMASTTTSQPQPQTQQRLVIDEGFLHNTSRFVILNNCSAQAA